MRFVPFFAILLLVIANPVFGLTHESKTVNEVQLWGDQLITEISPDQSLPDPRLAGRYRYLPPIPDSSQTWHWGVADGLQLKNTAIGYNAGYVFVGGYYSGGKMFQGIGGNGTILWETTAPVVGDSEYWASWSTGTMASETTDLFYAVHRWDVWNDNGTPGDISDDFLVEDDHTEVNLHSFSSNTPIWSHVSADGFVAGGVDAPGQYDCSDDGTVVAVGGMKSGHLAVRFFNNLSSVPTLTYEDAAITTGSPRQLRLTADGTKCIFRKAATLYRVDVATGTLEDSYNLSASTDCFGVSADGSVVAYGFTNARVAVWNGTAYALAWSRPISGYYGGAAAVGDDNSTIYFGFYRSDAHTSRIYRHDISSSTPIWTYDFPTGGGGYQDIVEWMECSNDGRWLTVGTWGSQTGGGPEIEVFDDLSPTAPNFTIDTPGSMFHVSMTPDGQYIAGAGKHVHANEFGSGGDAYFAQIEEGDPPARIECDLTLAGQTFITKSKMDFSVCYTNVSTGVLGDNETLEGQLRALLFANGKSAGDFSTLLEAIPVLNPGATWCDEFSATVPVTTKSKKVQKILRVPTRAEVRVRIDSVAEVGSADYAAFRIEEKDGSDNYWLIDNDEGHDINPADGFGGTTAPGVELGPDDSVFGNEGFWASNFPNSGNDVWGTYLGSPPNAGALCFLSQVDVGIADFGATSGASVAMIGVYHDDGSIYPDLTNPIYGPTTFVPIAANSVSGGDHGVSISISPASIGANEPIWTLYFYGAGRNDGWGLDNPGGVKSGGGVVNFEASFASTNGFTSVVPVGGNLLVAYKVNDPAGAMPGSGESVSANYRKWKGTVLQIHAGR